MIDTQAPFTIEGFSGTESITNRIDLYRGQIAKTKEVTLEEIRSGSPLDIYNVARRSNLRETCYSNLLQLRYPQTHALIANSLTEVTGIPPNERSILTSTNDFYDWLTTLGIVDKAGAERDFFITARIASVASYAQRLVSSDELSERLGINSGKTLPGQDFGVFEARISELNDKLGQGMMLEPDFKKMIVRELKTNSQQYHDIVGGQIFATSIWAFDEMLQKLMAVKHSWAMHKIETDGKQIGYYPLTLADASNGYGAAILAPIIESNGPYPIYSAVHTTLPYADTYREVKLLITDPKTDIVKGIKVESMALRTNGVKGVGLTEDQIHIVTANSRKAAVEMMQTSNKFEMLLKEFRGIDLEA